MALPKSFPEPAGPQATISSGDWSGVGAGNNGESWDYQTCSYLVEPIGMSNVTDAFPPRTWTYEWLDSHHSFSVRYTAGEDLGLDMHTDDSDVTFNVCLGKPGFTAAGLTFCGVMGKADHRQFQMRYRHEIGRCITHLGQQRHGADDIAEGTRINLIMWNKSLVSRRRKEHDTSNEYERESGAPSEQCLSYTHDRDYTVYKPHPKGHSAKRGWCPPPGKEYQNPSLGIRWKGDQ